VSGKQEELVTVLRRGRNLGRRWAVRVSNQTIRIARHKIPDSDEVYLEDKYGHRYTRSTFNRPGTKEVYFELF
jgi:hypothetical protein